MEIYLPVIVFSVAPNTDRNGQLANTAMSPAEHSWRYRQRNDLLGMSAGAFSPKHLVLKRSISVISDVFSNTMMSPVRSQRTR